MTNYIITSNGDKLSLPLHLKDVKGVEIVSTNSPHGMLFVCNNVVQSYFTVDKSLLDKGSLVCVPLIDDFKDQEKKKILKQLENLDIL